MIPPNEQCHTIAAAATARDRVQSPTSVLLPQLRAGYTMTRWFWRDQPLRLFATVSHCVLSAARSPSDCS
jgi:hypothetical protein